MMTNEALQQLITTWFPELEFWEEGSEFLNIEVEPAQLHALMTKLKQDDQTKFDYLFCLSGVDWGESLGVIYHLDSNAPAGFALELMTGSGWYERDRFKTDAWGFPFR